MKAKIVVPTSVFRSEDIENLGQSAFISEIASSGSDGIEIRHELFTGEPQNLNQIKESVKENHLFAVYSAPVGVWNNDGKVNKKGIHNMMEKAHQTGSSMLKLCLGHFDDKSDVEELGIYLNALKSKGLNAQLLVENDQTDFGGRIRPLYNFFQEVMKLGVPVRMTFDMGNWQWTGEDVTEACQLFKDFVGYLHVKSVKKVKGVPTAVPIAMEEDAQWFHLIRQFRSDIPRAIEFPVEPYKKLHDYIEILK